MEKLELENEQKEEREDLKKRMKSLRDFIYYRKANFYFVLYNSQMNDCANRIQHPRKHK